MVVLSAISIGNATNYSSSVIINMQLKEKLPARGEFIVRDAYVMTMDPMLSDLAETDVHIRNGEIISVGKGLLAQDVEEINGQGK